MKILLSYSSSKASKQHAAFEITRELAKHDGINVVDRSKLVGTVTESRQHVIWREYVAADLVIIIYDYFANQQNSALRTEWTQLALMFQNPADKPRVLVVRTDKRPLADYLTEFLVFDFASDRASALETLVSTIKRLSSSGDNAPNGKSTNTDAEKANTEGEGKRIEHSVREDIRTAESPTSQGSFTPVDLSQTKGEQRNEQLQRIQKALSSGSLTLFCGAGISSGIGLPQWNELLLKLLRKMMRKWINDETKIPDDKTLNQFREERAASPLIIAQYLKNSFGADFLGLLRDELYGSTTSVEMSQLMKSIAELARPQRHRSPLDSIVTFNFDSLIEEALEAQQIPFKTVCSESVRHAARELPIYHVHGFLPRKGIVSKNTEIVFSEDAYHRQFTDAFSWSNLIQLSKLAHNTCLFVGVSLTDPNMRRLLDVASKRDSTRSKGHYLFRKTPKVAYAPELEKIARTLEEQDAQSLGLSVIWCDDYGDIPQFLRDVVTATH